MKKVFLDDFINLDNLIKYDSGTYSGKINWDESKGRIITGSCKNIKFKFEITNYYKEKQKVEIKYLNKVFTTYTSSLLRLNLDYILGFKTKEYKFKKGDIVTGVLNDFKILDTMRKEVNLGDKKISSKAYKVKCIKCDYEDVISESDLKKEVSCKCCKNKVAILGVNTIWDTDKFMIPIVGEQIAKTHVHGSGKFVEVKCPHCGKKSNKKRQINHIYQDKGISCVCKDFITYPEKFIFKLLEMLNIDFVYQLTSKGVKWVNSKRYDFYFSLNKEKFIIEANGEQHPNTKYYNDKSFKSSKTNQYQNDIYKKALALENGIKEENYMVIDCSLSNKDFIKNEILNSRLSDLFNLSIINWNECENFALTNLLKEVCDYWSNKNEKETTGDLATVFKLDKSTIRDYLKRGTDLGLCKYDAQTERKRGNNKSCINSRRRVEIFDIQGNYLDTFESIADLVRISVEKFGVNFDNGSITHVCRGRYKAHKGYKFKYVD